MNKYISNFPKYSIANFIPLPRGNHIPERLGMNASPWLDDYITFSKLWSPRSFDGFHEAVGLWILSTVAARRVAFDFGKRRYTNLSIALIARTGVSAKSSVARIGKDTLLTAGLDWLLLPDTCTPQKMINYMTLQLPEKYVEMSAERRLQVSKRLGFAGQHGWYYDEFGMLLAGMMSTNSAMSDFRGILRKFDDTEERFENATITRGHDIVDRPYLALLASLTPADLIPFTKAGSSLWGDGFLARFALVAPDSDYLNSGRFPLGHRSIPASIISPLQKWHKRLGEPEVQISGSKVNVTPLQPVAIGLDNDVIDSFYQYDGALMEIASKANTYDLDGNYTRLPEKALRIAALLAGLENSPTIQIRHFARAQNITERWRANLHNLYRQLNENGFPRKRTDEEKVLNVIDHRGSATKREIQQSSGMNAIDVQDTIDILLDNREIIQCEDGRTTRYKRNEPTDPSLVLEPI